MLVGAELLLMLSEAIMEIMARGNRPRNKFSNGFRRLLTRTSKDIEAVISVLISKRPK